MSLSAAFARATYRLYPRITVDAAGLLVAADVTGTLDGLRGSRHCTVVSFRKDGTAVATPVWFAVDGDRLVFRSLADAAKVRRLQRVPQVLVARCTGRGRPTGPPLAGTAAVLGGSEAAAAEDALRAKYGTGRRMYRAATRGAADVYVAVSPAERPGPAQETGRSLRDQGRIASGSPQP